MSVEPLQNFSKLVQEGIRGGNLHHFQCQRSLLKFAETSSNYKELVEAKNANCSSNNERIECELMFDRFHVEGRN